MGLKTLLFIITPCLLRYSIRCKNLKRKGNNLEKELARLKLDHFVPIEEKLIPNLTKNIDGVLEFKGYNSESTYVELTTYEMNNISVQTKFLKRTAIIPNIARVKLFPYLQHCFYDDSYGFFVLERKSRYLTFKEAAPRLSFEQLIKYISKISDLVRYFDGRGFSFTRTTDLDLGVDPTGLGQPYLMNCDNMILTSDESYFLEKNPRTAHLVHIISSQDPSSNLETNLVKFRNIKSKSFLNICTALELIYSSISIYNESPRTWKSFEAEFTKNLLIELQRNYDKITGTLITSFDWKDIKKLFEKVKELIFGNRIISQHNINLKEHEKNMVDFDPLPVSSKQKTSIYHEAR